VPGGHGRSKSKSDTGRGHYGCGQYEEADDPGCSDRAPSKSPLTLPLSRRCYSGPITSRRQSRPQCPKLSPTPTAMPTPSLTPMRRRIAWPNSWSRRAHGPTSAWHVNFGVWRAADLVFGTGYASGCRPLIGAAFLLLRPGRGIIRSRWSPAWRAAQSSTSAPVTIFLSRIGLLTSAALFTPRFVGLGWPFSRRLGY
jgi:hypothetical protein